MIWIETLAICILVGIFAGPIGDLIGMTIGMFMDFTDWLNKYL